MKLENILKLSVSFILIGKGYEYLFWDTPIRAYFTSYPHLGGLFDLMGWDWHNYINNLFYDNLYMIIGKIIAFLYIITAIVIWVKQLFKLTRFLLISSSIICIFFYLSYWKEHFFQIGFLLESSIQMFTPLIYYLYIKNKINTLKLEWILKILVATTFVGHGLYAIGFHPTPGHFIDMVIYITGADEPSARVLLSMAGVIDFAIAILLLVFKLETIYPVLYYFIFWGLWTSFARLLSGFSMSISWFSFHQEWFKVCYRLGHAFIPYALLIINNKTKLPFQK